MKDYFKMMRFMKGYESVFALAVFFMLLASIFEGFQMPMIPAILDKILTDKPIVLPGSSPNLLFGIVDKINSMDRMVIFWWFPFIGFAVMTLKHFFIYWYTLLMSEISQRVMREVRNRVYAKIMSLSLDYYGSKRTGELVSRITYDANIIENAVSYALIDLFRQTMMICIYLAITLGIYAKGTLLLLVVFPLIGIPMSKIGRALKKISKETQKKMADINSHIIETVTGIKVVKAFNTEKYEEERFVNENFSFYKLKMKAVRRFLLISPITEIIGFICAMIVFCWLGLKVMSGEMSTGVFFLFIGSFMMIISPIKKLSNVNAIVQQALAANERIYKVLDLIPTVSEIEKPVTLSPFQNSIDLDHVDFQYSPESGPVLKDINLKIKKGELVAIVGPTGSGKSTLVNLIPRFYDPTTGCVLIDGLNLKDSSFSSLRDQFGIVTQDTILFNDSVGANIAYGHRESSRKDIEEAAKRAFAHEFIKKMPNGYETNIGDKGFRLSGGEKQRISIARAILRNPSILILDEATSQLDSESEKFIQEALDQLMEGRTVVAIAHRLSTIKKADKIVVLEAGEIIGQGKHENLLKECPLYNKLHSIQFHL